MPVRKCHKFISSIYFLPMSVDCPASVLSLHAKLFSLALSRGPCRAPSCLPTYCRSPLLVSSLKGHLPKQPDYQFSKAPRAWPVRFQAGPLLVRPGHTALSRTSPTKPSSTRKLAAAQKTSTPAPQPPAPIMGPGGFNVRRSCG